MSKNDAKDQDHLIRIPLKDSYGTRNDGRHIYSREPVIKNIVKPETPTSKGEKKEEGK